MLKNKTKLSGSPFRGGLEPSESGMKSLVKAGWNCSTLAAP